jgi:hypothetical protein
MLRHCKLERSSLFQHIKYSLIFCYIPGAHFCFIILQVKRSSLFCPHQQKQVENIPPGLKDIELFMNVIYNCS